MGTGARGESYLFRRDYPYDNSGMLFQIQQNSDVIRFMTWGRGRELHLDVR